MQHQRNRRASVVVGPWVGARASCDDLAARRAERRKAVATTEEAIGLARQVAEGYARRLADGGDYAGETALRSAADKLEAVARQPIRVGEGA